MSKLLSWKKRGGKFCHNCGYDFEAVGSSASQSTDFNTQINQNANADAQFNHNTNSNAQSNQNPIQNVQNHNSHMISKVLGYICSIFMHLFGVIFGI